MFPDSNKIQDTLVDCYHTISNLIADIRHLTLNKVGTGQHWKKTRRDHEQTYGRFLTTGALAPWHITNFEELYQLSRQLKCPKGWPDISRSPLLAYPTVPYLTLSLPFPYPTLP